MPTEVGPEQVRYATDRRAQEKAEHAVGRGLDRELPPFQRIFLYMPFMHSENLEHQRRAVKLFAGLGAEGEDDTARYAVRLMEIIGRFARFPHRNEIPGRQTTPEQAEFLTKPGSSF